ncbi:hypothetical protein GCM10010269_05740 [Streptomyces humidus]|uniref:Uncharacterized protein n=1 Tax=Streptomyces humidus TaxID=52259 RepID=A0A918FQU0_9ACTN|nr:hypothetical protein GCM10010269_05740 [Streptomyces humidus]
MRKGVPFVAGSGQGGAAVDSLRRRSGGGCNEAAEMLEEQRDARVRRGAGPVGVTCGSAVQER